MPPKEKWNKLKCISECQDIISRHWKGMGKCKKLPVTKLRVVNPRTMVRACRRKVGDTIPWDAEAREQSMFVRCFMRLNRTKFSGGLMLCFGIGRPYTEGEVKKTRLFSAMVTLPGQTRGKWLDKFNSQKYATWEALAKTFGSECTPEIALEFIRGVTVEFSKLAGLECLAKNFTLPPKYTHVTREDRELVDGHKRGINAKPKKRRYEPARHSTTGTVTTKRIRFSKGGGEFHVIE